MARIGSWMRCDSRCAERPPYPPAVDRGPQGLPARQRIAEMTTRLTLNLAGVPKTAVAVEHT